MASSYSTNLKIELINPGEQNNTWGATTNSNFSNAFESAIVGVGTVNFATDANTTITLTDQVAATVQVARNLVLTLTSSGSLSATRDLIVPNVNKPYIIFNNTTGGQAIRVKTAAGTGITVANGARTPVYCDGTNVNQQATDFPSLSVGGSTVANTSGAQTLTNKTISGASNTLSNISLASSVTGTLPVANGGTGVTSSTGTGSVVLSASPTFTGTPIAPTAANGTNTTQIATTAFVYNTVGAISSGVTTFSGGTTGLTPSGATSGAVTLGGTLAVANGGTGVTTSTGTGSNVLSASPALTGTPTAPTAVGGTNTTQIATTAFVTAAVSGATAGVSSFSAGTTGLTPSTSTTGAVTLSGTLGVGNGGTGASTAAGARTALGVPATDGVGATGTWGISVTGSAASASSAGSVTNSVTFNDSGSGVASGTAYNGSAARTISYNTVGAPKADGTNASGTWNINVTGNAGTAGSLYASSAARLTADSNGTVWPVAGTKIRGAFTNADINQRAFFQTNSTNEATFVGAIPSGSGAVAGWQAYSTSTPSDSSVADFSVLAGNYVGLASTKTGSGTYLPLTFSTNGSERARISTAGAVSINSTSADGTLNVAGLSSLNPTTSGALGRAAVITNGSFGGGIALRDGGGGYVFYTQTNGDDLYLKYASTSGAVNGNGVYLTSAATAWASASDARLKTDIKPIDGGLAKLKTVRAVTGRYLNDDAGTSRAFLIAQDFERVLPEAVAQDADGYLGLRYTEVVPLLVAAIKDLAAEVDALKARLP